MKPLFEFPELLNLNGSAFTGLAGVLGSGGSGCTTGCDDGCCSGCDGGGGDGKTPEMKPPV
jgi:hypothetical protein